MLIWKEGAWNLLGFYFYFLKSKSFYPTIAFCVLSVLLFIHRSSSLSRLSFLSNWASIMASTISSLSWSSSSPRACFATSGPHFFDLWIAFFLFWSACITIYQYGFYSLVFFNLYIAKTEYIIKQVSVKLHKIFLSLFPLYLTEIIFNISKWNAFPYSYEK